jgi:hypothetical protein
MQGSTLSLDSASVSIPNASRTSTERVDLPMRAFAGGYYNNLRAMYDHLGVNYHSQRFLFEFAKADQQQTTTSSRRDSSYFIHASNMHKLALPRSSAVATIFYLVDAVYLLACYSWFSVCCFLLAPRSMPIAENLDEYLRRIRLPQYFVTYYLLPLMSSVTTCPHDALLRFPASDLTEYKRRTHGAPHYTVSNGVQTVQNRLVKGIEYELSVAVESVEPQRSQVKVCWKKLDGNKRSTHEEVFDRVVLAVAPDIVGQVFQPLRKYMVPIPTTLVESVVHNDRTLIGNGQSEEKRLEQDNAQLIYLRTSSHGVHRTESLHVQPCGAIVTTCPYTPVDPTLTIHSAKFTRVLRSPESKRIIENIFGDTPEFYSGGKTQPSWKNGDDNVWLVGGWCWDGMVLLEGCIVSAMRVADAFGVDVPWRHN